MTYFFLFYAFGVSVYAYIKYAEVEKIQFEKLRIIDMKNEEYSRLFEKYKKLQPEQALTPVTPAEEMPKLELVPPPPPAAESFPEKVA